MTIAASVTGSSRGRLGKGDARTATQGVVRHARSMAILVLLHAFTIHRHLIMAHSSFFHSLRACVGRKKRLETEIEKKRVP